MPTMEPPYLTVAVLPDPHDDGALESIGDLLRERGARPEGDGWFTERRRRMHLGPLPTWKGPEPRPVEILLSGGPLDGPDAPRARTVAFGRYVAGVLAAVAARARPLYGGVGVEATFPSPAELRAGVHPQGTAVDPFFVRGDVLTLPDVRTVLSKEFRRTTDIAAGTVFASWWPYVEGHPSSPGGLSIRNEWEGGRVLGRALMRHVLG